MANVARLEHPKPQMQRADWQNLNGEWDFAFDFGRSGVDRRFYERDGLDRKIQVPFCPESELSGIGYKDFIPAVWYQKKVELTAGQLKGIVRLHFGAVDYECHLWVNGSHKGGYVSFSFDITQYAREGENVLTLYVADDNRSGAQCKGKQCGNYYSGGCDYTRTTGIWQTVWLEFLPKAHIEKVFYYPNIAEGFLTIHAVTQGTGTLCAEALYEGKVCGKAQVQAVAGNAVLKLPLSELHLWEAGAGRLYDLKLSFEEDRVDSYFGMREIRLDGERFLINGKSVFQRLVLDQGFYPDGIYTAPTDEALQQDIRLSMDAGFNGARLHQKIFEERFLYHCDRMGYIVWGEQGNWGIDYSRPDGVKNFLPEWMEALNRDFNHPAIVGWCPFNETWSNPSQQHDDLLAIVYQMTKLFDTTRPCIDTSGNFHVATDIYDMHDYEQDPTAFAATYEEFAKGGLLKDRFSPRQNPIPGIPVFISEYGGIKWDVEGTLESSWGYGDGPKTEEEYIARYKGLTDALLDNPHMFGFCYTQLYDVEQEVNGLYTYHRKPKMDISIFREINSRKAAIED